MVYHTEITKFERIDQVKNLPEGDIYIHGLFLDGAAWSKQDGQLVESKPKTLFVALPILYITGKLKLEEDCSKNELFGS